MTKNLDQGHGATCTAYMYVIVYKFPQNLWYILFMISLKITTYEATRNFHRVERWGIQTQKSFFGGEGEGRIFLWNNTMLNLTMKGQMAYLTW